MEYRERERERESTASLESWTDWLARLPFPIDSLLIITITILRLLAGVPPGAEEQAKTGARRMLAVL